MANTKERDFVEIEYTGRIKESGQIFDLTDEALAKKENIYNPKAKYKPKIICLGENQIIPALDKFLIGKETGKEYSIELKPEESFGKKDSKLIKIVPAETLRKQNINPFPGLQINASGLLGTIRSVAGGRVTIDFNHPLAGKNLVYTIKINKVVEEDIAKLKALLENLLGMEEKEYDLKTEGKKATINFKAKLPAEAKNEFLSKAKEIIPDLDVSIS